MVELVGTAASGADVRVGGGLLLDRDQRPDRPGARAGPAGSAAGPAAGRRPSGARAGRGVTGPRREAGITVSVCGDAAADPRVLPLLIGPGVQTVSVPAARVAYGPVRTYRSRISVVQAAHRGRCRPRQRPRCGSWCPRCERHSAQRRQHRPPRPAPRSREIERADSTTARASSALAPRSSSRSAGPTRPIAPATMPSRPADRGGDAGVAHRGLLVLDRVAAPADLREGPAEGRPVVLVRPVSGARSSGHHPAPTRARAGRRRSRARARTRAMGWPRPPRGSGPCCPAGTRGAGRSPGFRTGSRPRPPRWPAGPATRPTAGSGRAARSRRGRRCRAAGRPGPRLYLPVAGSWPTRSCATSARSRPWVVGLARPTRSAISVTPSRGVPEPSAARMAAARSTDWIIESFSVMSNKLRIGHSSWRTGRYRPRLAQRLAGRGHR